MPGLVRALILLLFAAFVSAESELKAKSAGRRKCQYLPGDKGWPSQDRWDKLNNTISGRLIKTISPGHVCHDPNYDANVCEALKASWTLPQAQYVVFAHGDEFCANVDKDGSTRRASQQHINKTIAAIPSLPAKVPVCRATMLTMRSMHQTQKMSVQE